jgi:hypothetical protein
MTKRDMTMTHGKHFLSKNVFDYIKVYFFTFRRIIYYHGRRMELIIITRVFKLCDFIGLEFFLRESQPLKVKIIVFSQFKF